MKKVIKMLLATALGMSILTGILVIMWRLVLFINILINFLPIIIRDQAICLIIIVGLIGVLVHTIVAGYKIGKGILK